MSLAMVLKMFSDCSLFFAILGMVNTDFRVPLLIPAVLYGVSAGIATFFEEKNWPVLRRLCALLPWLCLLFGENALQMILLAVPATYCSLIILFGKLELEYYTYRRFFRRSLILLGAGCLIAAGWLFVTQSMLEGESGLDIQVLIRYGLVHTLCGIVLLRQLRLGVDTQAEGGRRQFAAMLAITATIVLCTVLAEPYLLQGVGSFVGAVLTLVATPFVLLVQGISWLVDHAPSAMKDRYVEMIEFIEEVTAAQKEFFGMTEEIPQHEPLNVDTLAIIVIVGVLSVVAVLLLIKSFQNARKKMEPAENVSSVPKLPKKKKEPRLSNRAKVRQAYRSFLREEQDLGMKLRSSDTSETVLQRIHQNTDRTSADDLRNVYLEARYDERQDISRKQVEQAKRATKATHKKK